MRELTILFMPESAYGPTSNCIGIGDLLRRRGHRVVFAAEASWQGKLAPAGPGTASGGWSTSSSGYVPTSSSRTTSWSSPRYRTWSSSPRAT